MRLVDRYRQAGWKITLINPKATPKTFKLKFSTNGSPGNYSHFLVAKDAERIQIRHQLRVRTKWATKDNPANMVCDVAVIKDYDLELYQSSDGLPNGALITFCECKHMSAFSELIASFIGVVNELQPFRLARLKKLNQTLHPSPFLFISGTLLKSAEMMKESVMRRRYDCRVLTLNERI